MFYRSFNDEMRQRFGKKVYKLSLDGGFTCPNRDGTVGVGGCIFCSGKGSGDFAEGTCQSLDEQIERAKARVNAKNRDGLYIAYFQSFTNTYAPVDRLYNTFYPVIVRDDISGLSVATRPDCLPDDVIELLRELNNIKPVWVELGLQTVNETTAQYIRRGYPLSVFDDAMARLKAAGLETVVHIILGLPGETREDMIKSARYVGQSGAKGIKLQLLHVLKNTDLYEDYKQGKFNTLPLSEYIDILMDCISVLPPDMVIHRLTGDGAKRDLFAPLWSGDKKHVLNSIKREFEDKNLIQGSKL